MSYKDKFELKILQYPTEIIHEKECPTCGRIFKMEDSFCVDDGNKLITTEIKTDNKVKNIISLFRKFSESANFSLNDDGSSRNLSPGIRINDDLILFSKKYPDAIFQIDCYPDPKFNHDTERNFISNGKIRYTKLKNKEKYDLTKLH